MAGARDLLTSAGPLLPLAPIVAFVLAFALAPVAALFARGLLAGGGLAGWFALARSSTGALAFDNSLVQGGLSALLAFAIGYPAGLFLGRYDWPGRSGVRSFLLLPFLLPSIVVVLGIRELFGASSSGATGLLSAAWPALGWFSAGLPGIVAANLVFNVPVVMLFTAVGCESASAAHEETAATLGASPRDLYRDVWGPPSLWGAATGALLTFLFSALAFAAPLVLGGPSRYTLEAEVYTLASLGETTGAALLALTMVLVALLPTLAYLGFLGRLRRANQGRRVPSRVVPPRGPLGWGVVVAGVAVLGGLLLFLGAVIYRSLTSLPGAGFGASWSSLFSSTGGAVLGLPVASAIVNTLAYAGVAAGIALVLGLLAGHALSRVPVVRSGLALYLFLPLLISPVLLAFALFTVWRPLLGGGSTVWILIIASQAILALPFALQSLDLPLASLSPAARESARTLGASPWIAYADADLPRIRSGLVAATLFAFGLGLGEFTATNFLYVTPDTTLSVAVYHFETLRRLPLAEAAAGLLLVVSLLVFGGVVLLGRPRVVD